MKVLFIITSSPMGVWLPEVTRPYWHLSERGSEIDFASPDGGAVVWDRLSDPFSDGSFEAADLVSRGFLSDNALVARLSQTIAFPDVDVSDYDAIHVSGGLGAAVDLYPNEELGSILEHFFASGKVVGAICHGAIALANTPNRVSGKTATGFSLAEDLQAEAIYGKQFIPFWPQTEMERVGINYVSARPQGVRVVVDGRLVTAQNQQSASEYSLQFNKVLFGKTPVVTV